MNIKIRFLCREIVGNIPNGDYEFSEGICVSEAADELSKCGSFVPNYADFLLYMVNSAPARPDTVLRDGDSLMLLRKVIGG